MESISLSTSRRICTNNEGSRTASANTPTQQTGCGKMACPPPSVLGLRPARGRPLHGTLRRRLGKELNRWIQCSVPPTTSPACPSSYPSLSRRSRRFGRGRPPAATEGGEDGRGWASRQAIDSLAFSTLLFTTP
jgi:hypothetical protein